jgi:hypothetical protein
VIVGVPVHVPVVELSVWPSSGVPLITGRAVLTGGAAATTAVCEVVALALPAAFVPVTTTRIVEPTSAGPSR